MPNSMTKGGQQRIVEGQYIVINRYKHKFKQEAGEDR